MGHVAWVKRILNFILFHIFGLVRILKTESSNFTLASLISRKRCRLDDITALGLRWTILWGLPVWFVWTKWWTSNYSIRMRPRLRRRPA
jgi:hypothetical protein